MQRPTINAPEGESIPALEARLGEVNLLLAVRADLVARALEMRLDKARELTGRFPDGRPPNPSEDDQLALSIEGALTAWNLRPEVKEPDGPTIGELEQELSSIEARLGVKGAPEAQESPTSSSGLMSRIFQAFRSFFSAIFRLFLGKGARSSVELEMRRTLEERRGLILQRIAAREDSEQKWRQDAQRACEVADAIHEAAEKAGFRAENPDPAAAVEWLVEWQQRRDVRRAEVETQWKEWEEIQGILGGIRLDELASQAAVARDEAASSAARVDPQSLKAAQAAPSLEEPKRQVSEEDRLTILHDLQERRRQESEYSEAVDGVVSAAKELLEAARLVGVNGVVPEEQFDALRSWQNERDAELEKADLNMEEWAELQRTLGQDTLEELSDKVEILKSEARDLSQQVGIEDSAQLPVAPTDADFSPAELEAQEARTTFDRAQSGIEFFAQSIPNVAEAEENLAAAKAESDLFQSLNHTIQSTIYFLEQAQDLVHRSIAPVLAESVREWLPRVTGGRYMDCRVDPESLSVDVASTDGRWQRADLLSHGTAEQVYLLLRFALSRHLTNQCCPLILDDAVAASDSQRKHDLLETVLLVSESTQVILFTHEDDVREWARASLVGAPHRLIDLHGVHTQV